MKFSLRLIPIGFLVFFAVVGVVVMSVAGSLFYQMGIERFLAEKEAELRFISGTISSPFWVHEEATYLRVLTRFFIREAAKSPGIQFIRIIDTPSDQIAMSSNLEEEGQVPIDLPPFSREVHTRSGAYRGEQIKELSLESPAGHKLWMAVSTKEVVRQILFIATASAAAFFTIFVVAGVFVFAVSNSLIIKPLLVMHEAVEKVAKEDFQTRLPLGPRNEFGELYRSFNQMIESVRHARERDKLISHMKSEFVTIVAHRLRTPLSGIKWVFSLLLEGSVGKMSEKQRSLIAKGSAANERLIRLVNDLLNISNIEEGRFGYRLEETNFVDLVEKVLEEEKGPAAIRNLTFEFKKPQDRIPNLMIDPVKISLALLNIIDNAIKYSQPGGKIAMAAEIEKGELKFFVRDAGIGVAKNEMSRLFTKFFRSKKAATMDTEGSGLGLYLTKNIIEGHGGKIWAESQEGKGSVFTFTLPLDTASDRATNTESKGG